MWQSILLLGFTQPTVFNCEISSGLLRSEWLFSRNDAKLVFTPAGTFKKYRSAEVSSVELAPQSFYLVVYRSGFSPTDIFYIFPGHLITQSLSHQQNTLLFLM